MEVPRRERDVDIALAACGEFRQQCAQRKQMDASKCRNDLA